MIRLGFLKPTLSNGDPADDGIWGPVTIRAYSQYWASRPSVEISIPVVSPAPAEPWWVSGTHWSLIAGLASMLLGFAGMAVDAGELSQALAMGAATVATLIGLYRNAARKNPIDPTLVARVGTHDIRLPSRLRRDPVSTGSDTGHKDPRGLFGE